MPSGRQDIMYTIEQQPTMSTVHHRNGHHYGQHHASSNVVDQNVTPTMHKYAPTMGHNVSSAHNTRYAPHHRDIYMAAPSIYTTGTAMYQAMINHPIRSATQ